MESAEKRCEPKGGRESSSPMVYRQVNDGWRRRLPTPYTEFESRRCSAVANLTPGGQRRTLMRVPGGDACCLILSSFLKANNKLTVL